MQLFSSSPVSWSFFRTASHVLFGLYLTFCFPLQSIEHSPHSHSHLFSPVRDINTVYSPHFINSLQHCSSFSAVNHTTSKCLFMTSIHNLILDHSILHNLLIFLTMLVLLPSLLTFHDYAIQIFYQYK